MNIFNRKGSSTIENTLVVPVVLIIILLCLCYMLKLHGISVRQSIKMTKEIHDINEPASKKRLVDVISDLIE